MRLLSGIYNRHQSCDSGQRTFSRHAWRYGNLIDSDISFLGDGNDNLRLGNYGARHVVNLFRFLFKHGRSFNLGDHDERYHNILAQRCAQFIQSILVVARLLVADFGQRKLCSLQSFCLFTNAHGHVSCLACV